ncbi:MAG: hypothetical protein JSW11_13495 [Candidatus Heimdallarchaeota archaeon]|nr:MAG: hypothetical protein JSW11_13495 [Candidatus Heimdallarchaeota archaeon]
MTPSIFVVQEHHSEGRAGLHWDFRLQIEDTLRSWVLRKPPPTTVGVKHLAIPVDNTPFRGLTFRGKSYKVMAVDSSRSGIKALCRGCS